MSAPPAELVGRFAAALARHSALDARLGLAVSGGPDSMALLLLAHAAIPGGFEAATVDHGLRPEAAQDCALVAAACAERGIACAVLRIEVREGNLQAEARAARYEALAEWAEARGLAAIATAHHADDQAETLLMRLNRGSGVAGLAGVRERGVVPGTRQTLLRPLLGFRRAELAAVVEAARITVAFDPSNADARFERVRLRRALAAADWLDPAAIATSAAHLAEADDALAWAARREWRERVVVGENTIRYTPLAPPAVALRVVARAVGELGGTPRGADLARLLDRLEHGRGGNLGGVLATVEGDQWVFRPEPPRRPG